MNESNGIFQAMAAVMQDVDAISKSQNNAQQGFKYRGIDDVYNSMHGILAKHGIFTTPEVLSKTREERTNNKGTVLAFTCLLIKYTFWHNDGSSVSCIVEGEGMDSGDKSSNKAMAVAHKYALLQTFCIPTAEEKDPDEQTHEVSSRSRFVLADALAAIDNASSMDDLKHLYAEFYKVANPKEREELTAAKDKQKVKLTFPGSKEVGA